METDPFTIPEFCRLSADQRRKAWQACPPKRITKKQARIDWSRPKTWTAEAAKIQREIDKAKQTKTTARLKALKERHHLNAIRAR